MSKFTEDQQNAFNDVIEFINDPNRKFHRISGGAGTGKSYFIARIQENILRHQKGSAYPIRSVAVTSTTNKATAVLKSAMAHTQGEATTIHSFMNLRIQNNFQTGEQNLVPTSKWVCHYSLLLIIDEASMIDRQLFSYIASGTDSSCKVLFVGDKNQLAPVKEKVSPAYTNEYSESLLVTPVRQSAQQALMDLSEQAKDTVLTGVFHPVKEVPGVIDLISGQEMMEVLNREYLEEDLDKRILCYTNKKVIGYNEYIRKIRGYTEPYAPGEIMVNNDAAKVEDKHRLYTDEMIRVIEREPKGINHDWIPGEEIPSYQLFIQSLDDLVGYWVEVTANPSHRAQILKYWSSRKMWSDYFRVKETVPDLRSMVASTSHKAQGSSFNSVIVDLSDISKCTNPATTARLVYVALTRPREHLYIRGSLAERYFK